MYEGPDREIEGWGPDQRGIGFQTITQSHKPIFKCLDSWWKE